MDDFTLKGNLIEAVSKIIDPQSKKSILDAHILDGVDVADGKADVRLSFAMSYPREARWELEDLVSDTVEGVEGVVSANVHALIESGKDPYEGAAIHEERLAAQEQAQKADTDSGGHDHGHSHGAAPGGAGQGAAEPLAGVGRVIAVASGKGGVGKSTVAVNLALALQKIGFRVGLLDIDIYGPSLPTLLGVNDRPNVEDKRIIPLEAHNLKLMSLGFLMDDDSPVIWRGPIVTGIIRQFLQDVDWSGVDYLIVDMPPGTGDAQLSLAQTVPVDGAVVVTTPSDLALVDAARGLRMFHTLNVDVLGIVENMSHYVWSGASDMRALLGELQGAAPGVAAKVEAVLAEHERAYIFGKGGGAREAVRLETELLGEIPLDGRVRSAGDSGRPIVLAEPDSAVTEAFVALAQKVSEAKPLGDKSAGLFSFLKD